MIHRQWHGTVCLTSRVNLGNVDTLVYLCARNSEHLKKKQAELCSFEVYSYFILGLKYIFAVT
jgi:hypothetical protein